MTVDVPSWLGRWCWLSIFLGRSAGIIKQFAMILQNVLPFGVQKGLIQLILFCFCFLGDWHVRANGLVLCSMTYIACRNLWDDDFQQGILQIVLILFPYLDHPGSRFSFLSIYALSSGCYERSIGSPNGTMEVFHRGWTMGQGLAKLDEGVLESMYWIQLES